MKIDVGMYVRHNYYGIGKITNSYESEGKTWFNVKFNCYEDDENHCGICEQSIGFKASHDIIDLIEVGDYVNGCIVCEIGEAKSGKYVEVNDNDKGWRSLYFNNQIYSILTHEQFEREVYKI